MNKETLLEHVKLAINPNLQDWVLFENGTYVIFDAVDTIPDMEAEAIKLMKEYGPAHAGGPAGDFSVTHLHRTEGWVVSGHGYGMYTRALHKSGPSGGHFEGIEVMQQLSLDGGVVVHGQHELSLRVN